MQMHNKKTHQTGNVKKKPRKALITSIFGNLNYQLVEGIEPSTC